MKTGRKITHGKWKSTEWNSWDHMKRRCNNPKDPKYKDYGGRGIKVCDRWLRFENFYADMGDKPSPKHSIERIDVNGNYEPGNVRWATNGEQQRNRTDTVVVEYNGDVKTLSEWSRLTGIPKTTLSGRIKRGWSVEKILGVATAD